MSLPYLILSALGQKAVQQLKTMFHTSIYGLFGQEFDTPKSQLLEPFYSTTRTEQKPSVLTKGLPEHNRCSIYHCPIRVLVLLVEQRGRGQIKAKILVHITIPAPLTSWYESWRNVRSTWLDMYRDNQVTAWAQNFQRKYWITVSWRQPAVEKWAEILGRPGNSTKQNARFQFPGVRFFSEAANQGKCGWQPSVSFKMRPTASCDV